MTHCYRSERVLPCGGRISGLVLALFALAPAAQAQEATNYGYDALGRLVAVSTTGGPSNGVTSTYALDRAGNRTRVTASGGGSQNCAVTPSGLTELPYSHAPYDFVLYLSRTGTCAAPTIITYATRNGSALAGSSYVAASGTLTLTSGVSSYSIAKLPNWGSGPEEIFYVDYAMVSGGTLSEHSVMISRESP